ncbi:uncharacterized protein H6S33_012287 [Morchella sextelata]|uniref:uncharacterized protein n=1 Tax=Morchella sextelata TaxID=1174677 RepID=UPI001D049B80|nr:uncharacterized protein H6S33_012287 [Morchella sextelata]KAH0609741.1 hypothetical protein H6S33_012287 [Morchella sextelata]
MAPPQAAAAAGDQAEGGFQSTLKSALNGILIFVAVQSAFKYFAPQQTAKVNTAPPSTFDQGGANTVGRNDPSYLYVPEKAFSLWPTDAPMDVSIYVNEHLALPPFTDPIMENSLVFNEKQWHLNDPQDTRSVTVDVPFSEQVQNNGSLFAHIFVSRSGAAADPYDAAYDPSKAFRIVKLLTRYAPKKKVVKTKKLIGRGDDEEEADEELPPVPEAGPSIASYWHSNLTLDVVSNGGVLSYNTLPPPLRQHVVLEATGARDETGRNGWYYPIFYINDFWLLKEHMVEINSTVKSLPMHINLAPTPFWKFQIYSSLDASFKQQASQPGLGGGANTGAELEEFKRVLIETNIYLLGTTAIVSLLHTVFEMLAFKSDISHWRNKKDNVGISVRTILANVFMQIVIFLYLLDNSEGTSWMILFGQGMGIVLEAWKITRMVDVKIQAVDSIIPYRIRFEDKHKLSSLEKETKEYDEEAFKYLYWVAVPLLAAYAAYSLMYDTHKSWYSFIITTLVGSVYAYGFLMMVPSLYINYRLKSVAHMPRKTMVYKLLNTFIDDLFAFTIKMPTLHRLATLRDDVIYFIALYQAWIYRVDYRRVNEFGQGGDEIVEVDDKTKEKLDEEILKAETEPVAVASSSGGATGAEKAKGGKKRK